MKREDFCSFLKKKYGIRDVGLTFRKAADQTVRIWRKNRSDTALKEYAGNKKEAVNNLIRSYDRYTELGEIDKDIDTNKKYLDAINLIAHKEGAPDKEKEIKELNRKLDELNERKQSLAEDIQNERNIDALTSEELEYRRQRSKLSREKYLIEDKIARTKINLITDKIDIKDLLYGVDQFFPNIEMRKISEVQSFHEKITTILKKEMTDKLESLNKAFNRKQEEIHQLDMDNVEFIQGSITQETVLNQFATVINEIKDIRIKIENYEQRKGLKEDIKHLRAERLDKSTTIHQEIESIINASVSRINDDIYGNEITRPEFSFSDAGTYNYVIPNDTGTGREYYAFIILDQTIANSSDAPYIIHDTFVFKNIEYNKVKSLLNHYPKNKQSFISLDGISIDDGESTLIKNNTVIQLSEQKTLFNKKWNVKQ